MKQGKTFEANLLAKTDHLLTDFLRRHAVPASELRMQLLEAVSSRLGGFDLGEFHAAFGVSPLLREGLVMDCAQGLVRAINQSGIPPALALSALARESLVEAEQRTSGAYHTDFRLALHLAEAVMPALKPGARVVDPACGAGILLAAVSMTACGPDRILASDWLRESVHAADLSHAALRGALLSLASLTDDVEALLMMRGRWLVQDSLLAPERTWQTLSPGGFDVVVANPPWEKVKLTRHEFSKAKGAERHYGKSYDADLLQGYEAARDDRASWASRLVGRYPTLAAGEPDLYVAFSELLLGLSRPGGYGALLVPGGLIRSQGTEALRRRLVEGTRSLSLTVMENRARHFAIDTRFKFLAVQFRRAEPGMGRTPAIELCHGRGTEDGVEIATPVRLLMGEVEALRPDLTLPEVRTVEEWVLFRRMQEGGVDWSKPRSVWHPAFCREVDMTRDKVHFRTMPSDGEHGGGANGRCLPLVEGRMVQPHRLGGKDYLSGEGRRAKWRSLLPGESRVAPQFWMAPAHMASEARQRACQVRAGFCDITGQTNERTTMAALVPAGVVCGNKVPTVLFPNDPSEERLLLWLAIVNSLPFDWLMRRVVTTTVNYFVLLSLRLPNLAPDSLPGRRLVGIARQLSELDRVGRSSWDLLWCIADLRAEADVLVANAYGCTDADLRLMLDDFPLLDRGQPAIRGEVRSTVTHDLLLTTWARRRGDGACSEAARVEEARHAGAAAYLQSEFSVDGEMMEAAHG